MLLVYIIFFSPLASFVFKAHEREYSVINELPSGTSTILVLGSGGTPEVGLSVYQRLGSSALQRCLEGVRLWKKDPQKILVFSSQGRPGFPSQASLYADVAREMGVTEEHIRLIENGVTTETEALDFITVFPQVNQIILVTSAAHLKRAARIFGAFGVKIFPAPTDFQVLIHPGGNRIRLWPSSEALSKWNNLIHEWVGLLWVEIRLSSNLFPAK